MEQRVSEIITDQQAILDGEIVVTIVRQREHDTIVSAGHGTMVVGRERLTPLA